MYKLVVGEHGCVCDACVLEAVLLVDTPEDREERLRRAKQDLSDLAWTAMQKLQRLGLLGWKEKP